MARNVHARRFHDELVVLDVGRGEYFSLDEVGTRVWEGLVGGKSVGETIAAIEADYAGGGDVARDVLAFAAELVRKELLVEKP
jgi:hypothetical protein